MENIIKVLTENDILPTMGEARKLVMAGAIKVNGKVITDIKAEIPNTKGTEIKKGKCWEYKL